MPTEGRCQIDNSIFLTADVPSTTLTRRLAAGEVVRLGTGLYIADTTTDPVAAVKREWLAIVGRMLPGAVITDRSARTGGPVDGILYVTFSARNRAQQIELPGLTILARPGSGRYSPTPPYPAGPTWHPVAGPWPIRDTDAGPRRATGSETHGAGTRRG
jgi:hypothetical protein